MGINGDLLSQVKILRQPRVGSKSLGRFQKFKRTQLMIVGQHGKTNMEIKVTMVHGDMALAAIRLYKGLHG